MYRVALLVWSCVFVSSHSPCEGVESDTVKAPNVLMISIDDINDYVGYLGGELKALTPNIDRLANSGVAFTRAYAAAGLCRPSRNSVMTGMYCHNLGELKSIEALKERIGGSLTLSELFRSAGYRVYASGKIYHGSKTYYSGGGHPDLWDDYQSGLEGGYRHTKKIPKAGLMGLGLPLTDWGSPFPEGEYPDQRNTEFAINKLNEESDNPFFIALGLRKPHTKYYAPERYFEKVKTLKIPMPLGREDDLEDVPEMGRELAEHRSDEMIALKKMGLYREALEAYLGCIHYADDLVGRVLEALNRSPHCDNTIVVLWGDHGYHFGEKQHMFKRTCWEQGLRTPFVFRFPVDMAIREGVCEQPVLISSLYPTFIDLLNLPPQKHVELPSLLPLIKNSKAKGHPPALSRVAWQHYSLRTPNWRYIRYSDGSVELYDHARDPNEWTNLAGEPKYKSEVARLNDLLEDMLN